MMIKAVMQARSQLYGYLRWCIPRGHLWSGRNEEHPDWRGVCVTCGKVDPHPGRRRFILMGDTGTDPTDGRTSQ